MEMRLHQDLARPVFNERALIVDDALVVGDLHLGLEYELRAKGITIKPQWDEIRKRLFHLLRSHSVNRLVILGDLKHNIPAVSWQEYKKLPGLIEDLSDSCEVTIIKGNHDGLLEELLGGRFEVLKSKDIGNALFAHGHMNVDPSGFEYLILGHNHPCVELRDELGYGIREPAWARAKLNEFGLEYFGLSRSPIVIIVPAFNAMLPGNPLNSNGRFLGPLFNKKMIDLEGAEVFLLDGTSLGALRDLKSFSDPLQSLDPSHNRNLSSKKSSL